MAKLAHALDLGSSGKPCRFESCHPHHVCAFTWAVMSIYLGYAVIFFIYVDVFLVLSTMYFVFLLEWAYDSWAILFVLGIMVSVFKQKGSYV